MNKGKEHSYVVDEEISDIKSKTDINGILYDIKYLMQEYYIATFSERGDSLIMQLSNGQVFEVCVSEVFGFAN